ncbi:MAG: TIGR00730 family Rossman fold protein, partial [Tatlockia sp.]|nr:TIGR00730 family Rossman fold protein [Tatlockia sp.]
MVQNGSAVIGVIPKSLFDVEIAHGELTELHVVNSIHERKALISELADGFIMLPGGPGSLDEFFEMFTWGQLGHHAKPCGILNIAGYYDYLLKFLDNAVLQGFLKQVHRDMIIVDQSPALLINSFINYKAPSDIKWIDKSVALALCD